MTSPCLTHINHVCALQNKRESTLLTSVTASTIFTISTITSTTSHHSTSSFPYLTATTMKFHPQSLKLKRLRKKHTPTMPSSPSTASLKPHDEIRLLELESATITAQLAASAEAEAKITALESAIHAARAAMVAAVDEGQERIMDLGGQIREIRLGEGYVSWKDLEELKKRGDEVGGRLWVLKVKVATEGEGEGIEGPMRSFGVGSQSSAGASAEGGPIAGSEHTDERLFSGTGDGV
ncbi:hypothetical protein B9Z65_6115 [Elsinoe australis]|uniref:Uncharacterized protein n=1 Tax=Elsinoe australis TaxID=40998 RepID=A0A2P8A7P7_9PEZI|nr:hypothetical protein B9Z65_6115 [Elsinoe australis]